MQIWVLGVFRGEVNHWLLLFCMHAIPTASEYAPNRI